jgi:hypothetical protein
MSGLLEEVLKARGGAELWESYSTVETSFAVGGQLLNTKVSSIVPVEPGPIPLMRMLISTKGQDSQWRQEMAPGTVGHYSPSYVAIKSEDGEVLSERRRPRDAFSGHDLETPWDALHRTYFAGCAVWTYLNTPFLFTLPGVKVEEVQNVRDQRPGVRALRVTLPHDIASHASVQTFYFDEDFLLVRQDYSLEVAGGRHVAHFADRHVSADGLMVPTRRRAYLCDGDHNVLRDRLMIWIDFVHINYS